MNAIIKYFVDRLVLQAVGLLAQWLGKYLPNMLMEWKRKKERELAQEKAKEEYDKVIADDGATKEDRMKALENLHNAGRK